jgi:DNA replication protein DnaC
LIEIKGSINFFWGENMDEYTPDLKHILKEDTLKPTEETSYKGCNKCDAGYLEDGKMCECMIKLIKMRKYQNANIDFEYASLPIDEDEVTAFLKDDEHENGKFQIILNPFIEDYINNAKSYREDGRGIIFCGPVGRGKSLSAMKILMNLVDKGYTGYFITIKELLDMIKKSWTDEDFEKTKNHIYNCDFLVLDDLGTEYKKDGSDWAITELDGLMRHRYYKKLPLITTTNSNLEKLTEKYAQRIVSLFQERSLIATIVSLEDYRPKLGKIPNYTNKNKFMKG